MKYTSFSSKLNSHKIGWSKAAIWLIFLVWTITIFNQKRWEGQQVIHWDIVSYYSYLPATFIYNDLSFSFVDKLPEGFTGRIWVEKTPENRYVQKMTMGLSFLYFPFFVMGHLYALFGGYPTTGYSLPYELFLSLSSLFYATLALFFLRKVLLNYFTEKLSAFALIAIALGTNLYYYVSSEGAMSHAHSFFLFAVFIWLSISWHKKSTFKNSIFLGLTAGLITLIRPVNISVVLFFIFYEVENWRTFEGKISLFIRHWKKLLLLIIAAALVLLPQLIYWKYATGSWLYYSYNDEGFFFAKPQIINGLFSYRKGWLLYTPLMIFALLGLFFLKRELKKYRLAISIFMLANVYVIFSWWTWWYGGSFGARPMIESYAFLSIPLTAFLKEAFSKKMYKKLIISLLVVFFIVLNQFQSMQYRRTIIHWDSMTKEAYWAVFFRQHFPPNYNKLIKAPDYEKAKRGENE